MNQHQSQLVWIDNNESTFTTFGWYSFYAFSAKYIYILYKYNIKPILGRFVFINQIFLNAIKFKIN